MAKKLIKESIPEPIIDPIKPIKVKKIKNLGVEIPKVVMESVVIKDLPIKPKRVLSPEQLEKMKIGRIKAMETKLSKKNDKK